MRFYVPLRFDLIIMNQEAERELSASYGIKVLDAVRTLIVTKIQAATSNKSKRLPNRRHSTARTSFLNIIPTKNYNFLCPGYRLRFGFKSCTRRIIKWTEGGESNE